MRQDGTRAIVQIAAIGVALAGLVVGAMLALNALAFSQGQDRVRAGLRDAIADGTILTTRALTPLEFILPQSATRRSTWPLFTYECLMWTTLIAPGLDAKALTLRTIRVEAAKIDLDRRAPANPDCQAVLQVLEPAAPAEQRPYNVPYDRYFIGQRVLAQLLLSNFSPRTSAIVVQVVVYAAFILALLLAWRRRAVATALMCATLLLFYGLSFYGGTVWFGALDLTHAIFIIAALLVPLGTATTRTCAVFGALYGAFVAQFDVLTGGIPVGLAIIALLAGNSAADQKTFMRNVSVLVIAFCLAFASSVMIRLSIVSVIEGSNQFARHFPGLLHRLRGDIARETPPDFMKQFAGYLEYPFGQIGYLISIYRHWSRIIGWGSSTFGTVLVASSLIAVVVATVRTGVFRRDRRAEFPPQLMGCWLALGFLIAWMALFWNHTLVHPFFMARFLVIPVMSGAVALAALYAASRLTRRRASSGVIE
ncbi:MAG: hypothetical protein K2Y71_09050 [Xanthobacteraceae bacterium]|nr:hypothetical protein [Xanthobacteraceae bacterium]